MRLSIIHNAINESDKISQQLNTKLQILADVNEVQGKIDEVRQQNKQVRRSLAEVKELLAARKIQLNNKGTQ